MAEIRDLEVELAAKLAGYQRILWQQRVLPKGISDHHNRRLLDLMLVAKTPRIYLDIVSVSTFNRSPKTADQIATRFADESPTRVMDVSELWV